jgi:fused signal recognition particle receptor
MRIFNFLSKKDKQPTHQPHSSLPIKTSLWEKFNKAFLGKTTIDADSLDTLEELLLAADVGIPTTIKIIKKIESHVAKNKYLRVEELQNILQTEILHLITLPYQTSPIERHKPHVILVVGVNGVGKTTTIGKLAAYYKSQGNQVILGAADTFRAAASQQLQHWSNQTEAQFIPSRQHADPSAVAYETLQQALQTNADVAIIDTAGRLHTKNHLMQELAKIRRTIEKKIPGAPHQVLLVLDATTGQNAFVQTKAFSEATAVTGLVITKLDGTAKGGVIVGIIDQFQIPVQYIGIGEKIEDLLPFNEKQFVETLCSNNN